jgi:protein-L-isoaspartate(D-aspartate) O-methyltransferase
MEVPNRPSENEEIRAQRQAMVDGLRNLGRVQTSPVEEAFRAIPRHLFVPEAAIEAAYTNTPIITREKDGQPISSSSRPSIMAIMLEMLHLQPGQRVLEIGAGTGYNAALMAQIVGATGEVVTLDIDEDIVQDARTHLQGAGIENVQVLCSDGHLGWTGHAPYDAIILTVASTDITPAWREQLRLGGRLVLPLQLTLFDSKLAASPLRPDQFLLSFAWTGTMFEGLDCRRCGFMSLRGDLVSTKSKTCRNGPETGLSALLAHDIDAPDIFQALHGLAQDEETSVHLTFVETAGLRRWLALRDPRFCEIYVQEGTNAGEIPAQLRKDATFAAAIGLCEQHTCCLLMLRKETSEQAVHSNQLFTLIIRQFGASRELARQLHTQVIAWDQAGRPFVWNGEGRMKNLHVQAWPAEAHSPSHPLACVVTRQHTRFVFTQQATKRS